MKYGFESECPIVDIKFFSKSDLNTDGFKTVNWIDNKKIGYTKTGSGDPISRFETAEFKPCFNSLQESI